MRHSEAIAAQRGRRNEASDGVCGGHGTGDQLRGGKCDGTEQREVAKTGRLPSRAHDQRFPAPPSEEAGAYVVDLGGEAFGYFFDYEHRQLRGATAVKVLQEPVHGALRGSGGGAYTYFPSPGYLGKDKAVFDVEHAGEKLQVIYFFRVIDGGTDGMDEALCSKKVRVWKISYSVPLAEAHHHG